MVIAGDPQQLPPTVSAPQAVAAQLDRTVFERLQVRPCSLSPLLCALDDLLPIGIHMWGCLQPCIHCTAGLCSKVIA